MPEFDQTTTVSAGTSKVIKPRAGRLRKVLVTAAGTDNNLIIFYDNPSAASGTIIGVMPSGLSAGSLTVFNMPASLGIYCSVSSGGPALTVSFD